MGHLRGFFFVLYWKEEEGLGDCEEDQIRRTWMGASQVVK